MYFFLICHNTAYVTEHDSIKFGKFKTTDHYSIFNQINIFLNSSK